MMNEKKYRIKNGIVGKWVDEIRDGYDEMKRMPKADGDLNSHFEELVSLSNRPKSRFKIIGDPLIFTIRAKPDHGIMLTVLIIILYFQGALLAEYYQYPVMWLIATIMVAGMVLFFRYYPSTNDIEINSMHKIIRITSNNLLGVWLIPKRVIPFSEFKGFSFKGKSMSGKGMRVYWHRIYIHQGNKALPMIDLPNGPYYFVNHKIFINSLTRIILSGM